MILTLFVALFTMISASNKTAIDYYESGDLKNAKTLFLASSNPDAMDHYYLGQICLRENNSTDASKFLIKGCRQIRPIFTTV